MSEPIEPLPPRLEALFEAERPGQHVPPEQASRIWTELETTFRNLPPLPPVPPIRPPPHWLKPSLAHALTTKQLVAIGAGLLGVGLATGTVVGSKLAQPPAATPLAIPAVPQSQPLPPVPAPPVVAPPTPDRPEPAHRRPAAPMPTPMPTKVEPPAPPPPAPAPRTDSDLGAEQALLEIARTALERGKPQDGLAALDRHLREFPHGRLAEEREALRVQALAAAGDREGAAKVAESFARIYPQSLLGPAVREALRQSH